MVQRRQQRTALLLRAKTVKPHGVEALEDIAIFAVQGRAPVLFDEALDVLEARDDAFLLRGASALCTSQTWRNL
jgi:hypothetical protein